MSAKVSIVVPVYNVEEFLPECLDSLIGQTYKNIEIICVDDGSTDGSSAILKEYAKKDKRIIVVKKKNGGLSSARNAGLNKCKGDYVMFCDSDDAFAPTMCEKMVGALERSDCDFAASMAKVVYSSHEDLKESDDDYYTLKYAGRVYLREDVIRNVDVSVWNKIFKRSIIEENKIRFPDGLNNEDYYFFNSYVCYSYTAFFVFERLYLYRRRDGSIMSDIFKSNKCSMDQLIIFGSLLKRYADSGFIVKHKNLFWRQWLDSYHFSIEWSAKEYHKKIISYAKKFLSENYEKYRPDKAELCDEIERVFLGKNSVSRKIKGVLKKCYVGTRIHYRHLSMIENNILAISSNNDLLRKKVAILEKYAKESKN